MDTVVIQNNIKKVLDAKEISPYRLAQMWGKHPNHVYKLVNPAVLPDHTRLITILDIARLLDVSIEDLITWQSD